MLELTIRIVFSLLIVFGLLWGLAKLARRPLAGRSGALTVIARQQLSRSASVAVVRVADRALVLGVSDSGVSLLADADADLFAFAEPEKGVRRTPLQLHAGDGPVMPGSATSSVMSGSVLSPDTWRQAARTLRDSWQRRTGGRTVTLQLPADSASVSTAAPTAAAPSASPPAGERGGLS
jgi:flagellar protein FliO/FliZ